MFNGGVVFYINLRGGTYEATIAGVVQLFVSAILAGFTGPFAVRSAQRRTVSAYFYGSLVMASGVALFGALLHWSFASPNLLGTILWTFSINLLWGGFLVFVTRSQTELILLLKQFLKRP